MTVPAGTGPTAPAERFCETFDGYALPVRVLPAGRGCRMLALHGARSNLERLDPWLRPLQARGVASLAGSLSGHGSDSPLALDATSLARNLQEALRFAARLSPGPEVVMGHSLGGALALKVAEAHAATVHTLVLGGPALYPEAAFAAPHFGPPFTAAISVPFGFRDSASLAFLRRFQGRVLLVTGEYDGLPAQAHGGQAGRSAGTVTVTVPDGAPHTVYSPIPAEVLADIRAAAGARCSTIVLEGCDHRMSAHLARRPAVADRLAEQVQRIIAAAGTGPAVHGRIGASGAWRA